MFKKNEQGVTAIEYALIMGLIATVILGAFASMSTDLSGLFSKMSSEVSSITGNM